MATHTITAIKRRLERKTGVVFGVHRTADRQDLPQVYARWGNGSDGLVNVEVAIGSRFFYLDWTHNNG